MLLTRERRRPRRAGRDRRTDRESGSALAALVGVVAVTGVVATAVLTTAVFGTGSASADRAGVQARAAAEGGVDHARADLAACVPTAAGQPGTFASPSDAPAFVVRTWHRASATGAWQPGCPDAAATEVLLRSTGWAAHPGVAGHDRGDSRTVEAVVQQEPAAPPAQSQFVRAVVGDQALTIDGFTTAVTGDMSTNGAFKCRNVLLHTGTLYVGGTVDNNGLLGLPACLGLQSTSAFDPTVPPNVFPQIRRSDTWPGVQPATWGELTGGAATDTSCTFSLVAVVTVSTPTRVDCAGGITIGGAAVINLAADLVLVVDHFTVGLLGSLTVLSLGGDHTLSIVHPWPEDRVGGCPATSPAGIRILGTLPELETPVLLYSSTGVELRAPTPVVMSGQVYGCRVQLSGLAATTLTYTQVGPAFGATGTGGPPRLVSSRDLLPGS